MSGVGCGSRVEGSRIASAARPQFKNNYFTESLQRFRGGLIFKAHRLVYHSTLGWRVIKKRRGNRLARGAPLRGLARGIRGQKALPRDRERGSRDRALLPGRESLLNVGGENFLARTIYNPLSFKMPWHPHSGSRAPRSRAWPPTPRAAFEG